MKSSKLILQAIRDGRREFRREDYADTGEFEALSADMASFNESGFLKGYRIYRTEPSSEIILKVAATHGLSDEGMDYLIRIGG